MLGANAFAVVFDNERSAAFVKNYFDAKGLVTAVPNRVVE